jgi:hypothetical protein
MSYQDLKKWRTKVLQELKNAFGTKCGICNYDRCSSALEFHHIDPLEKLFTLSDSNINNWNKLRDEAKKCVLLCANCHREFHNEMVKLPLSISKFDETKVKFEPLKTKEQTPCKVCSKPKHSRQQFCSNECHGIHRVMDSKWDSISLEQHIQEGNSYESIGRLVGVSGVAVKKRAKKLGYIS